VNIRSRKTVQSCRLSAVAIQKLEHDLLRKPSEAEVAKELGMPLADFQHQELGHLFENSIEGFIHSAEEGGEEVNELDLLQVHDPENEPDYIVMWRERCEVLVQRIDRLKDREQEIVRMLLDDKTLADIAKKLGVTESRVCQLRQTILEKLRRQLRDF
jgi:RNA polymerase sigma factor for flagellar operon FliA